MEVHCQGVSYQLKYTSGGYQKEQFAQPGEFTKGIFKWQDRSGTSRGGYGSYFSKNRGQPGSLLTK